MFTGLSREFWGNFVYVFFSPIRNDPKKTHKQLVGTHPVPGQSRKFVYVYVFFFSDKKCPNTLSSLLCLLSRRILWIFFSCLSGNFSLKNGGDFWWIFSGLRFPRNEARKILEKFGKNSEQNSGQNSGRKFEKFGKLSFCNFSDLTVHGLHFTVCAPSTEFP